MFGDANQLAPATFSTTPVATTTPVSLKDTLVYCIGADVSSDNQLYAAVFDLLRASKIPTPPADVVTTFNYLIRWEKVFKSFPIAGMPAVWNDLSNVIRGFPYFAENYLPKYAAGTGPQFRANFTAFADAVNRNSSVLAAKIRASSACIPERQKDVTAQAQAQAQAMAQQAQSDAAAQAQAQADAAAAETKRKLVIGGVIAAGVLLVVLLRR